MRFLFVGLLFIVTQCTWSDPKVGFSEFVQLMNDPEHGLVQAKHVNGLTLSMKVLPVDYLVHRELQGQQASQEQLDSLRKFFGNSKSFVLTLGPDEDMTSGDLMRAGVQNLEDYKDRVLKMNFGMKEDFVLQTSAGSYAPVLVEFEPVYGLKNSRSVVLVFTPEEGGANDFFDADEFDVVYQDTEFKTGMHHFTFEKSNLEAFPQLAFELKN